MRDTPRSNPNVNPSFLSRTWTTSFVVRNVRNATDAAGETARPTRLVVLHNGRLHSFRGKRVAEDAMIDALFHGVDDSGRSLEIHVSDPQGNNVLAAIRIPLQGTCEACASKVRSELSHERLLRHGLHDKPWTTLAWTLPAIHHLVQSPLPVLERSMGVSKSKTSAPGCWPCAAATPAAVLVICRAGERDHGGGRAEEISRTRLLTQKKPGTRLASSASEVMVAAERTCMVRRIVAGLISFGRLRRSEFLQSCCENGH